MNAENFCAAYDPRALPIEHARCATLIDPDASSQYEVASFSSPSIIITIDLAHDTTTTTITTHLGNFANTTTASGDNR
ncbi:hypothetical protein E8E14_001643 [Neopestalotiopsis sp. 37M]|nr:hypothetical protein E8E14_001643 [Neopestalotiopsis sp. 37M]